MKLTITMRNDLNETKTLQWVIGSSDLAVRWATLIKTTLRQNENYHSESDWFTAGYTQEHFDKIVKSMAIICARLNAEKNFNIPEDWFLTVNRESLNKLHLKFHELAEHIPDDFEINQLNYIVHNAESCLLNMQHGQKFSQLVVGFNVFTQEILTHEDYLEFDTYSVTPGSLLLGYDTIGKTLFHCYQDNDVDLIAAGMVRPKLNLTSAVSCYIAGHESWEQPARYHQWCADNDILARYNYDCCRPMHSGGQCVIGTPINWDADQLTDWLLNTNGVQVHTWTLED